MSRSWKNHPFISTGKSDKFLKRVCHKGLRHNIKQILHSHSNPEDLLRSNLPVSGEIVNDWDYARSDGFDVSPDEEFPGPYHFTKHGKLRK